MFVIKITIKSGRVDFVSFSVLFFAEGLNSIIFVCYNKTILKEQYERRICNRR